MPNEFRCHYCTHLLDRPGDGETRSVVVRRVPLARGGTDSKANSVPACLLCAQAKGVLTDSEFRSVMGQPLLRKQWTRHIHAALQAEQQEKAS